MHELQITIPDGKLAIEEKYAGVLLSRFASEIQLLQSGVPYAELGYAERRKESVTKVVEVQNPKKTFVKDKIAVVDLRGLIRAEDGMYSFGTRTKGEQLLAVKKDVIGALFRVDSGGGYMDGAEAMISAMREFGKPIVALSSLAGSAAYMIASEADQIFAETEFSEFGSIGVYITLDKQMREMVNKYMDFAYSTKSQNKNKSYRDYLKDQNMQGFIDEATHADEMFMKLVTRNRGLTTDKEETLAGGMFSATDAKKRGLIDGIKNIQESYEVIQKLAS